MLKCDNIFLILNDNIIQIGIVKITLFSSLIMISFYCNLYRKLMWDILLIDRKTGAVIRLLKGSRAFCVMWVIVRRIVQILTCQVCGTGVNDGWNVVDICPKQPQCSHRTLILHDILVAYHMPILLHPILTVPTCTIHIEVRLIQNSAT